MTILSSFPLFHRDKNGPFQIKTLLKFLSVESREIVFFSLKKSYGICDLAIYFHNNQDQCHVITCHYRIELIKLFCFDTILDNKQTNKIGILINQSINQ
ncbi:hypothetical protein DERF_004270 [Dermatophagoides farinae]|uniref:Uncharacterized protein n=1 Tax=Dermatophagoides farinae TaxID=6954 RepID=A0A922L5C3_DERFA|nr:hypothetical protein DERF_004270 [Dermatophagoides farinae]